MKTGIITLDRLLGLDGNREIEPGIIMLRGGPGSGKTTLALQIMANYLKDPANKGTFVSIELEPHRILTHVNREFQLGLPEGPALVGTQNQMQIISRDNKTQTTANDTVERCITEAQANGNQEVQNFFGSFCRSIRAQGAAPNPQPRFVIIDSLNALLSMLSVAYPNNFGKQDLRGQIQEIVKASRHSLQQSVVLFTGEYHPTEWPEAFGSVVSESFVCDVEILLRPEPVAGKTSLSTGAMNQLGYGVERHQTQQGRDGGSWNSQAVEIRSFCRVIKSRWTPNQARRCQYDIVKGKAVVFDETYPGDGELLLFHENDPQRDIWKDFFEHDIPIMFPALRFGTFDVKRLQRVFASQRDYGHRRIDLYLGSFDGYWLDFFDFLSQRILIRDALISANPQVPREKQFWNLVSDIHLKILTESGNYEQWQSASAAVLAQDLNRSAQEIDITNIDHVIASITQKIDDGEFCCL